MADIDVRLEQLYEKIEQCITIMRQEPDKYFVHPGKDFTRLRKISLRDLMLFYIFKSGGSIHKELKRYYGIGCERPSASAFVQQSKKLKPEAFTLLASICGGCIKSDKKYHGYNLWAVDGTDLTVAKNKKEETVIKLSNGTGNIIHNNLIYDLQGKQYINYFYQPKAKADERNAMIKMLHSMKIDSPTILTADRGYPGYNTFVHLQQIQNLKFVIRLKNEELILLRDLPQKCELDTDLETTIVTSQKYKDTPGFTVIQKLQKEYKKNGKPNRSSRQQWDFGEFFKFKIRVVRIEYSPGSFETLFTNLPREEFGPDKLKEIYGLRWGIETSFRQLKYATGMMSTNSKTVYSQKKEILAKITAFNFLVAAANAVQIPKNNKNKLVYQINYTNFVDTVKDYIHGLMNAEEFEKEVLREMAPVRSERKMKRPNTVIRKGYRSVMYRLAA